MTSCGDVDWALRSIDVDRQLIAGPPVFLPLDSTARLTEALARRVGERHLGALIGQRSEYTDLSWYSDFVLTAPTLGEAFQRGAKALPTLHPGCRVSLDARDGYLILLFHSEIQSVVGAHHIDEFMPMLLIDLGRRFLGAGWLPAWVELPDYSLNGIGALEEIYGVPVMFRPGAAGIALKLEDLAAPNPGGIVVDREVVLRDLPGLLGVEPPRSFSDLVVEVLRFQVILGDVSVETAAERLSLGVQTLQRRLRHEGTSFRDLRLEFLMSRAADLLTQTDHSVEAIARSLGYNETNSFRRAFRTRFGLTPTAFARNRP